MDKSRDIINKGSRSKKADLDVGEKNNAPFPTRLRKLLEQKEISNKDFAISMGVSPQMVSYWRTGTNTPDVEKICNIADYFNVSIDYLMGRAEVATMEADIQIACKVTGLNEEAIKHIETLANITELLSIIKAEDIVSKSDDISDDIKSKMGELSIKAFSDLSKMGIDRPEFMQYVSRCSCMASPIKAFESFCNHGIFEKICLYVSFYANDISVDNTKEKNTVLDDDFEDYTIWKLQNLISSEFKKIIQEIKIANTTDKEVGINGKHNSQKE